MADELIDIYDSDMNLLGVATESQAHQEGLWHKVFHCWVISEDGNVWLTAGPVNQSFVAGLLDIFCEGAVNVGETAKASCLRKLDEEFGLHLKEYDLVKMYTQKVIFDEPYHNREFCPTYLYKTQAKLFDLKLQPAAACCIYEADIQELTDLFFDDVKKISLQGIKRTSKGYKNIKKMVSKNDFSPRGDKFYQKALTTLLRFIDNQ